MDYLIRLLAQLFEFFKTKNPFVATIILLLSSTAVVTVQNGQLWGLFTLPEWGNFLTQGVGLFLTAVTGTQTFRYLPPSQQKSARP